MRTFAASIIFSILTVFSFSSAFAGDQKYDYCKGVDTLRTTLPMEIHESDITSANRRTLNLALEAAKSEVWDIEAIACIQQHTTLVQIKDTLIQLRN